MKKIAVVTDSTCCLPLELVQEYDIRVVPLEIIYEGKSYRDGIDMTSGEVYRIMRRRENLPTTSTPPAGDFLNAYHQLSREAENILCITLTSLQSQTFKSALAAREIAMEEIPGTIIEVLDSRAVAGSLGFIALEAARAANQGADLGQVIEAARNMMGRVNFLAMLDTLYYLARTGRTARATAWAGMMLSIKPILEHSPAVGETMPFARPRTKKVAVERILETVEERMGDSSIHALVHHADELEAGKRLMAEIESRFNCVEIYLTEFTPLMGVHTGPGLLGVSFYAD